MASSIALGCIRMMTAELPKMVAILQLKVDRETQPLFTASVFAIGHPYGQLTPVKQGIC